MALFGIEQFCSSEIISGKICFRRFASIFVRIFNQYIVQKLVSNILGILYHPFLELELL